MKQDKFDLNPDIVQDPGSGYNQARRKWLERALALGLVGATALSQPVVAQLFGSRPRRIQPTRSFSRIKGEVRVNGNLATINTMVNVGDAVETGPGASASFVVGQDAYQLRENTQLRILRPRPQSQTSQLVEEGLELLKGAALFVFGRREESRIRVSTALATVGIRGTGLYMEAEGERTYLCLCYGLADLNPVADSSTTEVLEAEHHDMPKYIYGQGAEELITSAPFKDHTDLELAVLEELVGREVPFPLDEYYDTPRRDDY